MESLQLVYYCLYEMVITVNEAVPHFSVLFWNLVPVWKSNGNKEIIMGAIKPIYYRRANRGESDNSIFNL